jgi:hypothetical protein
MVVHPDFHYSFLSHVYLLLARCGYFNLIFANMIALLAWGKKCFYLLNVGRAPNNFGHFNKNHNHWLFKL